LIPEFTFRIGYGKLPETKQNAAAFPAERMFPMIQIENEQLRVTISPTGGTLQSVFGKQTETEYLWQADPAYWVKRAPNLFPFVGRLYEKCYTVNGQPYEMMIHGFAPTSEMEEEQTGPDSCVFTLRDNEETRAIYPYRFEYRVRYTLDQNRILIAYEVTNLDEKTLYFGVGGHPGFNVPMEKGLKFEDYALTFPEASTPSRVQFSDQVLVNGIRTPYALKDQVAIPLRHDLFDQDAVVLADAPRSVTLASEKGARGVRVSWPQMPYIGFWHKPHSDAPFVCIEPWGVLPGREGVVEALETMADMTALKPGETRTNPWEIEVW